MSTECFYCGDDDHYARNCPRRAAAENPAPAKTPAKRPMLSEQEIRRRIERVYMPATDEEMAGLVNTWKRSYKPGNEYPDAPRYPGGFLALLRARERARHQRSQEEDAWTA